MYQNSFLHLLRQLMLVEIVLAQKPCTYAKNKLRANLRNAQVMFSLYAVRQCY